MATSDIHCPLCGAVDITELTTFRAHDLVEAYRSHLGIDVSRFFHSDALHYGRCNACDLRFFHPIITGDPDFYRALSKLEFYYMEDKAEFRMARKHIGTGARVLEIGAGAGAFGRSLSGVTYVGLESNPDAAATAQRHGLTMIDATLEEHARANASVYDVVCAFQVLEHVDDPRGFIHAALLSLRDGGTLVVSVPSADSFVRHVANDTLNVPPHHVTAWTDLALTNLARIFALEIECIQHERLAAYHYGWYASAALRALWSMPAPADGPVFDAPSTGRLRSKVFGAMGHVIAWALAPIIRRLPEAFLPLGHTVVAVYRKR